MNPNRLGWHHLRLEIPDAWEVVGYGLRRRDGRLVLSDPVGETLQIHWQTMRRQPHLRSRLTAWRESFGPGGGEIEEVGPWLACAIAEGPLLALRHDKDAKVLLAAAFSHHARGVTGDGGVRGILASYVSNRKGPRTWAAFGLDVTLPPEWELESVEAWPAAQRLHFTRRRGERVTVHRYGMLPVLLGSDSDEEFFARLKGPRALVRVEGPWRSPGGGGGLALSYHSLQRGMMEVFRRPLPGLAWLWREAGLARMFIFEQIVRGQTAASQPEGEVRCR